MPDDNELHVHYWNTDRQPCECGAPVPAYLVAAWDRYAEKTAQDSP